MIELGPLVVRIFSTGLSGAEEQCNDNIDNSLSLTFIKLL